MTGRVFRFLGFIMFILALNGLTCKSQSDYQELAPVEEGARHLYKVRWNANPEADISHYRLYGWHGPDTSQSPFIDDSPAGRYSSLYLKQTAHIFNTPIIHDSVSFVANGDWLRFAVAAVNRSGGVSPVGVSNFLKSEGLNVTPVKTDPDSPNAE